jgi:hypothetical protein
MAWLADCLAAHAGDVRDRCRLPRTCRTAVRGMSCSSNHARRRKARRLTIVAARLSQTQHRTRRRSPPDGVQRFTSTADVSDTSTSVTLNCRPAASFENPAARRRMLVSPPEIAPIVGSHRVSAYTVPRKHVPVGQRARARRKPSRKPSRSPASCPVSRCSKSRVLPPLTLPANDVSARAACHNG